MRPPQVVLVAYRSPLWLKVAIGSFRAHFPAHDILVVDNNPRRADPGWHAECDSEREWLAAQHGVHVLDNPGTDRTHGAGMDLALDWCRTRGMATMLHLEPDCYVSGMEWYRQLTDAVERGAWMAACHRKAWGPLHPCPSLWVVDAVRASFRRADGLADTTHPRFAELCDSERYRAETGVDPRAARWEWDTGLKAWFEAAVADRAVRASGAGFAHYWRGSQTRREDLSLFLDPRLLRHTRPSLRDWVRALTGKLVARLGHAPGRR